MTLFTLINYEVKLVKATILSKTLNGFDVGITNCVMTSILTITISDVAYRCSPDVWISGLRAGATKFGFRVWD